MNHYTQMMGVGAPYNPWRRHARTFCAYAFPKRFGNQPIMRSAQPSTYIRPVYSRSVRPVVTSRPRVRRPHAYPLRGLGAPAEIQGLLGVGYPGTIAHGPDGHLYGWISGYDGLGTPLGFWGKLKKFARKGLKFAAKQALPHVLPMAQRLLPFVPGVGPAAATALRVARGAGLLGVAETGTPIYLGLDGYLYGVEGTDYEPVHGFGAGPMMHGLAADPIHGLEADYMHGLAYDHMHGLEDDYMHGLEDDYVHGLEDDYNMHGLEDDYVHGLEDDYVHGLEDDYVHGLEGDYMHGLEDDYVHGLNDGSIHMISGLEADYMDGLEDDHIHGLEADYMDGLEDDDIHGLEADYVHGLEGYIPNTNVMGYETTRPSTTPRFNPTTGTNVFQPYL